MFNEIQDLKGSIPLFILFLYVSTFVEITYEFSYTGNIRVFCRIRPFLPGQREKGTIIEYIGENGEVVIANRSKPGKEGHRLFKFNKIFGPDATQGF